MRKIVTLVLVLFCGVANAKSFEGMHLGVEGGFRSLNMNEEFSISVNGTSQRISSDSVKGGFGGLYFQALATFGGGKWVFGGEINVSMDSLDEAQKSSQGFVISRVEKGATLRTVAQFGYVFNKKIALYGQFGAGRRLGDINFPMINRKLKSEFFSLGAALSYEMTKNMYLRLNYLADIFEGANASVSRSFSGASVSASYKFRPISHSVGLGISYKF